MTTAEALDIDTLDKKPEKTTGKRVVSQKSRASKTKFHNFQQRTDNYSSEELEEVAQRKRDAYNKRSKGES